MTTEPLPPVAILAGGLATRLRPLTDRIPKSLVPVAGRPFLAHQLDLLRSQGVRRAVLCVGHLGEQIEAAFGNGENVGIELRYSYDGPALVGTAEALRRALPLLGDEFFTLYGDSYLEIDYQEVWAAYRQQQSPALMTVIASGLASDPANVQYESGRVRAYNKHNPQPQMRHVDYGLSIFTAAILKDNEGLDGLSDLQIQLARQGHMAGHEVHHPYFEIGSPQGLAALESHLRTRP